MANFIGLVYGTLKEKGVDTKGMSVDEAIKKFKELQGSQKEKNGNINTNELDKIEKQYASTKDRNEMAIKGFKDARSYMEDLANGGATYKEAEKMLGEFETEIDIERHKLRNKKEKTKKDIERSERLMHFHEGVSYAIGQMHKIWKE